MNWLILHPLPPKLPTSKFYVSEFWCSCLTWINDFTGNYIAASGYNLTSKRGILLKAPIEGRSQPLEKLILVQLRKRI